MADTTLRLPFVAGNTIYTQIRNETNAIWNGTAYVSYVLANWGTYAVSTPDTPTGAGFYVAQFPTSSAAGNYSWIQYLQAGGSPAASDVAIGSGGDYWDGTTFGAVPSVKGSVNNVLQGVTANSIRTGTAQGGTLTTITLDSGASATDNLYQNCGVTLTGGTGAGQSNVIAFQGYNGTTKVATMTVPWVTAPDNTTTFAITTQGAVVMGQLGGASRTVTQDWNGVGSLTIKSSATGQPISGAVLKAYLAAAYAANPSGAQVYQNVVTDASGNWTMSLAPAAYTVTVALPATPSTVSDTFPLTVN